MLNKVLRVSEPLWHDNGTPFRTPKVSLLSFKFSSTANKQRNKEIWKRLCCVLLKRVRGECSRWVCSSTDRVLRTSSLWEKYSRGCGACEDGWQSPAASSDNPHERGELVQVQDVDTWVSCWILQLWSEQSTTDFRIAPAFATASSCGPLATLSQLSFVSNVRLFSRVYLGWSVSSICTTLEFFRWLRCLRVNTLRTGPTWDFPRIYLSITWILRSRLSQFVANRYNPFSVSIPCTSVLSWRIDQHRLIKQTCFFRSFL